MVEAASVAVVVGSMQTPSEGEICSPSSTLPYFCRISWVWFSPVMISLFPTSIDLDPIFKKDRDLDRFRFSYRAGRSVGRAKYFRHRRLVHPISCHCQRLGCIRWRHKPGGVDKVQANGYRVVATRDWRLITPWKLVVAILSVPSHRRYLADNAIVSS